MTGIVWEEPEPADYGTPQLPHYEIAAELRQHPGQWAKILTSVNLAYGTKINNGRLAAYRPAGSFEAVVRNTRPEGGSSVGDVYARYVGEDLGAGLRLLGDLP